jgi:hypothetical protein
MRLSTALNVDFPRQDSASNQHREDNDGQVDTREFEPADLNMLPGQDVPPQEARQGCTESGAEGAIIDTQRHAVDGGPPSTVTDGAAVVVYLAPDLYQAR